MESENRSIRLEGDDQRDDGSTVQRFTPLMHSWDLSPREAKALQTELSGRVRLRPLSRDFGVLAAADIAYLNGGRHLVAAVLTFAWPGLEPLEAVHVRAPVTFPYVPGLLSFREAPAIIEACRRLKRMPEVLLCDGQGIAHPRRFGLASHLGLYLGVPTVGCAKKLLCGTHGALELRRGNAVPLLIGSETVGWVCCSRNGVKPIYVSPGHLSDPESARDFVFLCLRRFRIPEPLRQAHQHVTLLRRHDGGGVQSRSR